METGPNFRWWLIKTCQDLVRKSREPDLYSKLRMAGLLRHLLVGPRSLLFMATDAPTRESLQFWYREPGEERQEAPALPGGFDASRHQMASGRVKRTDVNAFLRARIVNVDGWFTVQQLIDSVVHVYGGQYQVIPDGVDHEAVFRLAALIEAGGAAGHVPVALHEITGVTTRALLPLVDRPESTPANKTRSTSASQDEGARCPFSGAVTTAFLDDDETG